MAAFFSRNQILLLVTVGCMVVLSSGCARQASGQQPQVQAQPLPPPTGARQPTWVDPNEAGQWLMPGKTDAGTRSPGTSFVGANVRMYAGSGVKTATGQVSPPLGGIGSRSSIAGVLPNTPQNLIRWIQNPPAIDPRTAMPNAAVTDSDARESPRFFILGQSRSCDRLTSQWIGHEPTEMST
jgi:hypothetical protein